LVQLSLARAGRAVARDSDIQAKSIGTPVDEGVVAASVGDLLFCDGHVGLLSAPGMLLHANAYHMAVAEEPLPQFIDRIAARGLEITAVRRPQ
jgi:cell wall-associated NlpC family hydrolase